MQKVHALQDAIAVDQKSVGGFATPNWDQASQKTMRDALLVLAATLPDFRKAFGTSEPSTPFATCWAPRPHGVATLMPMRRISTSRLAGTTAKPSIV